MAYLIKSTLESQSTTSLTYIWVFGNQIRDNICFQPSVITLPCISLSSQTKLLSSPSFEVSQSPLLSYHKSCVHKPLDSFWEMCSSRTLLTCCFHQLSLVPSHTPSSSILSSIILGSQVTLGHTPHSSPGKAYLKSRSQQRRTDVLHVPSSRL